MIVKAKTKIGTAAFEFIIEEKDDMEALHVAAILSSPLRKCGECGNEDPLMFKLNSNKADSYTFVYVQCKCGAKSNLGQYTAGGYFWKPFEKYVKPGA